VNARSRGWLSLKARIEQFVTLEQISLAFSGRGSDDASLAWYRVVDPERLLITAVSEPGRPAEQLDPFWAATWRAAQGLDRFLSRLNLSDVRVLELGCGSGQAGVGAALQGARVTMTDAVGLALLVARLNAWPLRDRIEVRRILWNQEKLPQAAFPLILGSDLVYDPALFPLLEACARQHLATGGRLYLSEPHRHTGDLFAQWIRHAGWLAQEHDMEMNDGRVPIRVFECWLPSD
jgi:predicted nicotinamide N-methyase